MRQFNACWATFGFDTSEGFGERGVEQGSIPWLSTMSCIRVSGDADRWAAAQAAPSLPFSVPEPRVSKVDRVRRMAKDSRVAFRVAAAGSADATGWVLWCLAGDKSWLVRSWVARNPRTPVWVLVRLWLFGDSRLRHFISLRGLS